METELDQSRIDAREALLDAVAALESHSDAAILVGAQAVYVHTESDSGSFAVSPFTYDADIALDPLLLRNAPSIVDAMRGAGFVLGDQPGLYTRDAHHRVDLLVPAAVGGAGRRGARLSVHGNTAAMKVRGLEGALVSHAWRTIGSLRPGSARKCVLKVAGPAALLVAKVHKIWERVGESDEGRREDLHKDAFDLYRLLRVVDAADIASQIGILQSHEVSSEVTSAALSMFRRLFGGPGDVGTRLVVRHVQGLENSDFISASSVALSQDLLEAASKR